MLTLQDEVSSGQAHPGQLKQAIYFLACKSLPSSSLAEYYGVDK